MTLPCSRISRFALSLLSTWVLAATVQADPRDVSYTYTTLGQIATVDGPRTDVSDVTRFAYDAQGNMTSVTNALNQTTTLSNFDTYGNPQTVTDPNGVVATFTYTPQGWLASSTIGASTTSYGYNEVGDVLLVNLADGNLIKYTYDNARRLVGVRNRLGGSINYTLDAMGNRTAMRVKNSAGTLVQQQQQASDELGRLIKSVGAGSQTQRYDYDLNDNQASSTIPRSNKTQQAFNATNRIIRCTIPWGQATHKCRLI